MVPSTACARCSGRTGRRRTTRRAIIYRAEPSVIGRVVDSENGAPLTGVVVFGFYSPVVDAVLNGVRSQWSTSCAVHRFEAVTDADGRFRIAPWQRQHELPSPARWSVEVAYFKAGYETTGATYDNSLRGWSRSTSRPASSASTNEVNVTSTPTRIERIRPFNSRRDEVESRHWQSHIRAAFATGGYAACGWEQTPSIWMALHENRKNLIRNALGSHKLDAAGYGKRGSAPPDSGVDYTERSEVDQIRAQFAANRANWKCADPDTVFSQAR